ncbi:MAG: response regulator [Synergistaceae bacterium]|nr:response regulator [Synergistaceae bacterium]
MEKELKKIIMVDDDVTNLVVAKNAFADKYDVFTVPSGKKLFQLLEKVTPDMILLDIEMPEMSGYEVIKILKASEATADIPVIFLTGRIDPESEIDGLDMGAIDYITKPFSQQLLLKRIEVHMIVESQKKDLQKYSVNLEGIVHEKTKLVFELQNAILKTVAELVECRDNVTGGHIERTQNYLRILVDALLKKGIYVDEISNWDIHLFIMSSQLHDVGKISIKDGILMKPGRLTRDEFEEMKKHTEYGVDIIKRIEEGTSENAFLRHAEILTGTHHEKWDGTGYPNGLQGEGIPLQGRLMSIVDVYDALTNDRPYKKAYSHKDSLDIIREGRGSHFDPVITDVFLENEDKYKISGATKSYTGGIGRAEPINVAGIAESVTKTIADIVNIRESKEDENRGKTHNYLKIFIDALRGSDAYKEEVNTWDVDIFLLSASLYDVGKIAVHDNILNKSGKLTEKELSDAREHANFGVEVVKKIREDMDEGALLHQAEALVGSHHEKWDGTGYPKGLRGTGIPLQGRVMAIVDVYDALTSDRPHRDMISHEEAVEKIKSYSGTFFDPELVRIFMEHEKEFYRESE